MKQPLGSLLKVDKKAVKEDEGVVYLLEITVEGEKYVKVGVTTRDIEARMCEIAISCWKQYRYMPHIYSKRYRKTTEIYKKESEILDSLKEYRAEPDKKISGHTEMHKVDLDCAVQVYEEVLKGSRSVVPDPMYCSECGKAEVFKSTVVMETEEKERYTCGSGCKSIKSKQENDRTINEGTGVGEETQGSDVLCGMHTLDVNEGCS